MRDLSIIEHGAVFHAFLRRFSSLSDIIIIPHSLTGAHPDFFLVFKEHRENRMFDLFKQMLAEQRIVGIVEGILSHELFEPSFSVRNELLWEGYSVYHGASFASLFGHEGIALFRYNLRRLTDTQRTQFYYSLYGRGSREGILSSVKAAKWGESGIAAARDAIPALKRFFAQNHISVECIPILVPARIAQKFFGDAHRNPLSLEKS